MPARELGRTCLHVSLATEPGHNAWVQWSKPLCFPEPSNNEYLHYPDLCRGSPDSELESSSIFLRRDSSVPDHLDEELNLQGKPGIRQGVMGVLG